MSGWALLAGIVWTVLMFALGFDTALCLLGIGSAAAWLGLVAQERLARRRRAL